MYYTYKKGFSLVELMVVIVVIAILAAITVVTYGSVQDRAHTVATLSNVRAYVNAIEILEIREGIFVGSGCIGGSPDEADPCSLTYRYTGSGCSDTSTIFGSERNLEFDAKMKQYLGVLPEQVLSQPYTVTIPSGENCSRTAIQTSALYQSYKSMTVMNDGTVNAVYSFSHPETNNQAWAVTFLLPDANAKCPLPNSYELATTSDEVTNCAVIGGNITYQ